MPLNYQDPGGKTISIEVSEIATAKPGKMRGYLLLQNRRDNATPWQGALGMAKALGNRAGFAGVDAGGHYVYGTGSSCADQSTIAFLSNGTLPAKPLYCPAPQS